MDVDAASPSLLHSLFLHWMSLPSTTVYIQHALHSIRYPTTPTPPSTSSPPPPHSPLPDSDSMKDDSDPPHPPNGLTEEDPPDKSFVINIPPLEVPTPAHGDPLDPTSPSPPTPTGASPPHRVALRVDTDIRFSPSPTTTSPPLSPKSPAKQSPPSSQSPDPSQHSPHKKRKSNTSPSPSTSPSSPPPHRLASVSPPSPLGPPPLGPPSLGPLRPPLPPSLLPLIWGGLFDSSGGLRGSL